MGFGVGLGKKAMVASGELYYLVIAKPASQSLLEMWVNPSQESEAPSCLGSGHLSVQ